MFSKLYSKFWLGSVGILISSTSVKEPDEASNNPKKHSFPFKTLKEFSFKGLGKKAWELIATKDGGVLQPWLASLKIHSDHHSHCLSGTVRILKKSPGYVVNHQHLRYKRR